MPIKNFIVTGDTHGRVEDRVKNILRNKKIENLEETALIILGDVGLNFYLDNIDINKKERLKKINLRIYCVRGNHEERPENLGYASAWDSDVCGEVYIDPIWTGIRYFKDGGIYTLGTHRVLVIGGAYSVDKWFRLKNNPSSWFKDELLTTEEIDKIIKKVTGESFDFVFTHTCPISWEPTDLFLDFIDQSEVDKSMELYLNKIEKLINWKVWCFGHYHADRLEKPRVEQFYYRYEWLEDIWDRWQNEKELNIYKSPNYNIDN